MLSSAGDEQGRASGSGECCRTLQCGHPGWATCSSLGEIPTQGELPWQDPLLSLLRVQCPWGTALAEETVPLPGCPCPGRMQELREDGGLGRSSKSVGMDGVREGSSWAEGISGAGRSGGSGAE